VDAALAGRCQRKAKSDQLAACALVSIRLPPTEGRIEREAARAGAGSDRGDALSTSKLRWLWPTFGDGVTRRAGRACAGGRVRPAVHLSFDHLDAVDVAFDGAGIVGTVSPAVTAAQSLRSPLAKPRSSLTGPPLPPGPWRRCPARRRRRRSAQSAVRRGSPCSGPLPRTMLRARGRPATLSAALVRSGSSSHPAPQRHQ
jgi:hypothetical protein